MFDRVLNTPLSYSQQNLNKKIRLGGINYKSPLHLIFRMGVLEGDVSLLVF